MFKENQVTLTTLILTMATSFLSQSELLWAADVIVEEKTLNSTPQPQQTNSADLTKAVKEYCQTYSNNVGNIMELGAHYKLSSTEAKAEILKNGPLSEGQDFMLDAMIYDAYKLNYGVDTKERYDADRAKLLVYGRCINQEMYPSVAGLNNVKDKIDNCQPMRKEQGKTVFSECANEIINGIIQVKQAGFTANK